MNNAYIKLTLNSLPEILKTYLYRSTINDQSGYICRLGDSNDFCIADKYEDLSIFDTVSLGYLLDLEIEYSEIIWES